VPDAVVVTTLRMVGAAESATSSVVVAPAVTVTVRVVD
jgi:hypothetical protein